MSLTPAGRDTGDRTAADGRPADGHDGGPRTLDRVKCVVWDLDNTVWDGVAVESTAPGLPEPRRWVLDAITALADRGVLSSVASRTDPAVLDLLRADARLAERFIAPQVGWQDKSESLRRIAEDLGIAVDALLLVDDSPYERAEVGAMLPEVGTLAPEQVPELLERLASGAVTEDARRRVSRYRAEAVRKEEGRRFSGSREEFLRSCDMRLSLGAAREADLPRVAELAARTHRLNSSGLALDADGLRAAVPDPAGPETGSALLVAELEDRFGGYGMIGTALVDRTPRVWTVQLLALSCRIAGRGVSLGFLRWLMDRARAAGAGEFRVVLRPTSANVELRLLFRQAGLRVAGEPGADRSEPVTLARPLDGALPDHPSWLAVSAR
ncbi:HAD-IIIC family phosphatase [Streptomyces sp. NPDC018031]|uniref:HAD-IIIC family phosphatase n=1 Tax=Streptomyces sp. NPDC018031 TaxID=3365033 RepID=UPI003793DA37